MIPLKQLALLFDLDGTLTDSGEGVINCVQLALRHFGIPCEDRQALRAFVGPPLRVSFPQFGVPEDRVEEAVAIYRSRYLPVGIYENEVYPGIRDLLEILRSRGFPMYVATSKPEGMAETVLRRFELFDYFVRVCGANLEGSRDSKEDVIRYLLDSLPEGQTPLMIGDTIYDVKGAAAFGIPTVGVSWGYGDPEELLQAGAVAVVHTPEGLAALLEREDLARRICE